VEDRVGEDRTSVGVEHDVGWIDATVGEARAVEVLERFREWAQEGYEFARAQGSAPTEQTAQRASDDVLAEQQPLGAALADLQDAGDVGVVSALQDGELFTDLLGERDRCGRDALEHSVAARGEVANEPDSAGRSGPEPPAQAVAGDVFECHALESARIAATSSEVIHSSGLPPVEPACLWTAAYGEIRGRIHSRA
jgi:hypothetical protein